jgi:hypothetical protein
MSDDECVNYCPVAGHMPLCSKKECREQLEKDGRESCKKLLSTYKPLN